MVHAFFEFKVNMKKRQVIICAFSLFFIISVLYIQLPIDRKKELMHSSLLTKSIENIDNKEYTIYRNKEGLTSFAADVGYAVKITSGDKRVKIDTFYDEEGNRIYHRNNYYAALREYDDTNRLKRVSYLGIDGKQIKNKYGYAIITYYYNPNGKVDAEYYLDENGIPTCSDLYGYGKRNIYDEKGNVIKLIFLDAQGNPMITGMGYASMTRSYYNDGINRGKVQKELYYDERENPISLTLGQFGIYKEYNEIGQNTKITYLDKNGNPMVTKKGYTTIIRTFHNDNTIATEQYYDINGEPFSLAEGQYGRSISNGQERYLDAEGKEQLNIKQLVYNQSRYVILFVLLLVLISSILPRKMDVVLIILYFFVVIYMTLLYRDSNNSGSTEILWYYRNALFNNNAKADILKNIWLFIPLGTMLYKIYDKKIILIVPIIISVAIEGIQYFTGTGFCELDDIISNSFGGCIGYYAGQLTIQHIQRIKF